MEEVDEKMDVLHIISTRTKLSILNRVLFTAVGLMFVQ